MIVRCPIGMTGRKGIAMTKYYAYYPRNFGNEYTVVNVANKQEEEKLIAWEAALPNPENHSLQRVTVKQLRNMAANERQARKHDQAFSGYCNPREPVTVDEFLNPTW
jgi:hypothetical protein